MIQTFAEKYRIVDQFNTTYWGGRDVNVYLGDLLLDEAVQLNYQIMERVIPYYHYSAYTPTTIHHGSRMISGELSINFKQSGYFHSVMQRFRQGFEEINRVDDAGRYSDVYQTGIGFNTEELSGNSLKKYIQNYENSQKAIKSVFQTPPAVSSSTPLFEIPPVNLLIVMGGEISNPKVLSYASDNGYTERNTIFKSGNEYNPLTGISLVEVHFNGIGVQIDDSGRPIMETMAFMCKDIRPVSGEEVKGYRVYR